MSDSPDIKILQVGYSSDIGGTEIYLINQFRCLDHALLRYDFVSCSDMRPLAFEDELTAAQSVIYRLPQRRLHPVRHYWGWLVLMAKFGRSYDAVVMNANSYAYGIPIFFAWVFGIKCRIYHAHSIGPFTERGLLGRIEDAVQKILIRFATTHYLACSEIAGRGMFGENAQVKIVRNGLCLSDYRFSAETRAAKRAELGLDGHLVLGMIGNFMPVKNHAFAVDVFRELKKLEESAKLVLIGDHLSSENDSCLNQVREKIAHYGLAEDVLFLGRRTDVPLLLQAMDDLVMPSVSEGFGIVAVEAQATGLPCFLSDRLPEDVKVSEAVRFLSINRDPKIWARAIAESAGVTRETTGNDIRLSRFDVRSITQEMMDFYREVCT